MLKLECFPTDARPPDIVPGRPQRKWMETFEDRHPYRCLPLTMANSTGWEILSPHTFTIIWNGGPHQDDVRFRLDHQSPGFDEFAKSHFSSGIVTFHPGYLFRTPPGWSMWVAGPPNHIKDGIQPLTGLVETDWLPFPFTMNWMMTRPGEVRFEKGEPFCFITLVQDKVLESFDVVHKPLESDDVLRGQYEAWSTKRDEFNRRLHHRDPEAVKAAWQRFYFKGELPDESGEKPKEHVNKRRLAAPRFGR
jgi:hypothetical protein